MKSCQNVTATQWVELGEPALVVYFRQVPIGSRGTQPNFQVLPNVSRFLNHFPLLTWENVTTLNCPARSLKSLQDFLEDNWKLPSNAATNRPVVISCRVLIIGNFDINLYNTLYRANRIVVVISCRRFGTYYQSHLQGSSVLGYYEWSSGNLLPLLHS